MLVIIRGEMVNPGEAALPEISHALSWQDHRLAPFISPNHPHYCTSLLLYLLLHCYLKV